jgi:hypothetical protein
MKCRMIEVVTKVVFKSLAPSAAGGLGASIAGPLGGVVGATFGDFLARMLSLDQKTRVERVWDQANLLYGQKLKNGSVDRFVQNNYPRKAFDRIVEGGLLAASDAYEEKKCLLLLP